MRGPAFIRLLECRGQSPVRCAAWTPLPPRTPGKGDRVKVKGHFRERTYQKDGETKTVRDFVVEDLKIERRKIRHQAE